MSGEAIKNWWPLISVAGVGLIAWGATTTTVAADSARITKAESKIEMLDDRTQEQTVIITTQTIKLETLEQTTGDIKADVDTIEIDVKEILLELRAMRAEQRARQ